MLCAAIWNTVHWTVQCGLAAHSAVVSAAQACSISAHHKLCHWQTSVLICSQILYNPNHTAFIAQRRVSVHVKLFTRFRSCNITLYQISRLNWDGKHYIAAAATFPPWTVSDVQSNLKIHFLRSIVHCYPAYVLNHFSESWGERSLQATSRRTIKLHLANILPFKSVNLCTTNKPLVKIILLTRRSPGPYQDVWKPPYWKPVWVLYSLHNGLYLTLHKNQY